MADKSSSMLCENLCFAGKEAFKRLRTNITFSFAGDKNNRVIGITSSGPSDGKSLVSINLAFSMYELGKRVLLVDADMRRPSVNDKLKISQVPGLANLLVNTNDVESCVVHFRSEDAAVYDVLPSGSIPPNPLELLNSERMKKLLEKLSAAYDTIIIDLPPVGAVADAQTVAGLTDGMVIVVRDKYCSRDVLTDCITQLKMSNAKILGFVLNGAVEGSKKSYSYNYGYYK